MNKAQLFHEIGKLMAKMESIGRRRIELSQEEWLELQDGLINKFYNEES